jgi:hypothetical protein
MARPLLTGEVVAPGSPFPHLRQDKLYSKENEGILHEVNIFPCHLQEKCLMQLPLTDPDTLFEELLPDLPVAT